MNEREAALRARLWQVFWVEAQEHLETLSRVLLQIEAATGEGKDPGAAERDLVETAFREAHSLKGAARSVNQLDVESVCQGMEAILSRLKKGELSLRTNPKRLLDLLLDGTRMTEQLLIAEDKKTVPPSTTAILAALKATSEPGAKARASAPSSIFTSSASAFAAKPAPLPVTPATPSVVPAPVPAPAAVAPAPLATASFQLPATEVTSDKQEVVIKSKEALQTSTGANVNADPEMKGDSRPEAAADSNAFVPDFHSPFLDSELHTALLEAPPLPLPVTTTPIETVRVSTAMLDSVRTQAEELLADKLAVSQHAGDLQLLTASLSEWPKRWSSVRDDFCRMLSPRKENFNGLLPAGVSVEQVVDHMRSFLAWNSEFFYGIKTSLEQTSRAITHDRNALAGKVDGLLESTRELLMLPFSWLLDSIHQTVRDLARDQSKEVNLEVEGDAIELDRRILAELKVPFVHILRNCLDHGIEPPAERVAAGKPRVAALKVHIAPARNGFVEVTISDDGRGIDTEKLKRAAIKAGTLQADEAPDAVAPRSASKLSEEEAQQLVFGSGVSTSPMITDLSGHGLGLAIVREKAEKLGGSVRVESIRGQGTTLRLRLPLTLSIFRGVVARVGDRLYVLPVASVQRVARVSGAQITTLENCEAVVLAGEQISLVHLSAVLRIPSQPVDPATRALPPEKVKHSLLVVAAGGIRLAIVVDEICGEQEIVAKKTGQQATRLAHIGGATILGNGSLALILDAQELLRIAIGKSQSAINSVNSKDDKNSNSSGINFALYSDQEKSTLKSILVTDDSITSRTLLKSILEAAGFKVETAVDGIDAFAKLRSASFDLVVTDVDMPRLHGVGLTEKIRADSTLSAMPIILVTSLDSREDRERGLVAGANAYIVKRNFEESNLLETVRRLL